MLAYMLSRPVPSIYSTYFPGMKIRILPDPFFMNGASVALCQCWSTSDFVIRGYTFWAAVLQFHPWIPLGLPGGCHMVLLIYLHLICQSGSLHWLQPQCWPLSHPLRRTSWEGPSFFRICLIPEASSTGSINSPSHHFSLVEQNNTLWLTLALASLSFIFGLINFLGCCSILTYHFFSMVSLKFLSSHAGMLFSFRVCYFGPWPHPFYPGILILYFKIASRFLWTCDFINFSISP